MDEPRAQHSLEEPVFGPSAQDQADHEERIRRLEHEARPLDPGAEERALLREKVVAYADAFMQDIDGRPAFVVSGGEDGASTTRRSRRDRRTRTRSSTCWIAE
jgi:hypothetical protein